MHANAEKWIKRHLRRGEARAFAFELDMMLDRLLGPILRFDFDGLGAGFPYIHIPLEGVLYLRYEREGKRRIALQMIGEPIPEGPAAERHYRKCMEQYNKLTLEGWAVLGFTRDNLIRDYEICEEYLGRLFERIHGPLRD